MSAAQSYRFAADSGIGQLAQAVNAGDVVTASAVWQQNHADIRLHSDEQRLEAIFKPRHLGAIMPIWITLDRPMDTDVAQELLNHFNQVCALLCALHDGPWGISGTNQAIGQRLQRQRSYL